MYCAACNSETLTCLGQLGNHVHYRCRDCGADGHMTAEEWEDYMLDVYGEEPDYNDDGSSDFDDALTLQAAGFGIAGVDF